MQKTHAPNQRRQFNQGEVIHVQLQEVSQSPFGTLFIHRRNRSSSTAYRSRTREQSGFQSTEPRKFYLTQTEHIASEALTACAPGYHMASLWEIHDTSNLRYDTQLGFVREDSGLGPPSGRAGWIRTGFGSNPIAAAGRGNCLAWASADAQDEGTLAAPEIDWTTAPVTAVSPWLTGTAPCNNDERVWCVQN